MSVGATNFDVEAFKSDRATFEAWREKCRNEIDDDGGPGFDIGEILSPLLLYLADGYSTGVIEKRAVALLVVVAPHLLADASYSEIAERLGCRSDDIAAQVRALRESMPALKGGYRSSQMSTGRLLSRLQVRQQRRQAWVDEAKFRAIEARKARKEWAEQLRERLANSRRAANQRALAAMKELDRQFGLAPVAASRPIEGQPCDRLGVHPDGAAAVGFVQSVGAKDIPRRGARWF